MPSRFRAVLFDFDGTLADSYTAITASVNHVSAHHGLPPLLESQVRGLVGQGLLKLMADIVPGGNPLYTYAVNPVAGPHVASISVDNAGGTLNGIFVTFSGPVDPATFTVSKVNSLTDPNNNPVPIAFIPASLAAKRAAYRSIRFAFDSQYWISPSVKTRLINRSP